MSEVLNGFHFVDVEFSRKMVNRDGPFKDLYRKEYPITWYSPPDPSKADKAYVDLSGPRGEEYSQELKERFPGIEPFTSQETEKREFPIPLAPNTAKLAR